MGWSEVKTHACFCAVLGRFHCSLCIDLRLTKCLAMFNCCQRLFRTLAALWRMTAREDI